MKLPKELYVVVDCEKIEPARYRVILNRKCRLFKTIHYHVGWSCQEGKINFALDECKGNMLEIYTDWVDAERHYHRRSENFIEPDSKMYTYIQKSGYSVLIYEAQVLTVGSVLSVAPTRYMEETLIQHILEGEYNKDIERILKRFKVTDYELPG